MPSPLQLSHTAPTPEQLTHRPSSISSPPFPPSPHDPFLLSLDPPSHTLAPSAPFSPLSSPLPILPNTDHAPHPSSLQPSNPPSVSLRPFNRSSSTFDHLSSFDSSSILPQPTSLPVPKRTLANIWAQPLDTPSSTSSRPASDLGLSSPLLGQIPMLHRRFSHLSATQPPPPSLFGSPPNIPEPIGPISLSTDRHRGRYTPTSPLSAGFGPNSLPSNFYQPWYDSNQSSDALLTQDERMGRSKARDILGSRPPGAYRDPSVGSIGSPCSSSARSGIGLSNMSPFTGTSLLPPGALSIGGSLATRQADLVYRANRGRDSSLGAIGSGRMATRSSIPSASPVGSGLGLASSGSRMLNTGSDHVLVGSVGTDSWLTGGRSLTNDLDEDDELAPPTKSGATSRRHSVSAFTGRGLVQGFESLLSRPITHLQASSSDSKKMNRDTSESVPNSGATLGSMDHYRDGTRNDRADNFGRGSSALTDDDLCFTTDFNSLSLNLETQPNQDRSDRLSFQLSHQNHLQSSQLSFHPNSNYSDPLDSLAPPPNNLPWSSLPASSQEPTLNSAYGPRSAPENFARKSSYSAGDPFSASAQASRYFASQAGNQHSVASRIPFGHSGPNLQSLGSISSPSVTTFSASGLLSAPSPYSRQTHKLENGHKQPGTLGPMGTSPFDPPVNNSFYSTCNTNPSFSATPLSPIFQVTSGLLGPSPTTQFNNIMLLSPRSGSTPGLSANELNELGKGIPLHQIPRDCELYIVEFKGGRTDLFYLSQQAKDGGEKVEKGDLVIVEADRGQDLGKVVLDPISIDEVRKFQNQHTEMTLDQSNSTALYQLAVQPAVTDNLPMASQVAVGGNHVADTISQAPSNPNNVSRLTKEIHPKKIFGKASQADIQSLLQKTEEERKALSLCRSKALQRGLQMEITSAEWQWDRRKLTFFFIADKRIDFRDLVKDLFRTWKTRIWMCSVNP